MSVESFGRIGEDQVLEVTIGSEAGARARIISWGAVLRELMIPGPGGPQNVVLGLDSLDHYLRYSRNFGAIVGRYANRIGGASFRLCGRDIVLAPNEGATILHGGPTGFGRRVWSLLGHDARSAHLAIMSEDGDGGFPGRLFATCTYEMIEPATLRITLQAVCDQLSPVNLTTHTYYNLDGSEDVRDHHLRLLADHITPTDAALIPTGAIEPVAGTRFDFRASRPIRTGDPHVGYDINFVLARGRDAGAGLSHAATLESRASGIAMQLWTTEPGLQLYDGRIVDVPVPGLGGRSLRPYCGVALEPQRFPDSPNHTHFPAALVAPGEVSRQVTEFRFGPRT